MGTSRSATDIEGIEQAWIEAVQAGDLSFLESLLASDFTLTTGRPGAEVRTRAEYLRAVQSEYRISECHFEEMKVRAWGSDVAVAQSRYWQRAEFKGVDRSGAFRMTDVFVRDSGRWRAVLRHSTAIPVE